MTTYLEKRFDEANQEWTKRDLNNVTALTKLMTTIAIEQGPQTVEFTWNTVMNGLRVFKPEILTYWENQGLKDFTSDIPNLSEGRNNV